MEFLKLKLLKRHDKLKEQVEKEELLKEQNEKIINLKTQLLLLTDSSENLSQEEKEEVKQILEAEIQEKLEKFKIKRALELEQDELQNKLQESRKEMNKERTCLQCEQEFKPDQNTDESC